MFIHPYKRFLCENQTYSPDKVWLRCIHFSHKINQRILRKKSEIIRIINNVSLHNARTPTLHNSTSVCLRRKIAVSFILDVSLSERIAEDTHYVNSSPHHRTKVCVQKQLKAYKVGLKLIHLQT